jgi:hypothetical protein
VANSFCVTILVPQETLDLHEIDDGAAARVLSIIHGLSRVFCRFAARIADPVARELLGAPTSYDRRS